MAKSIIGVISSTKGHKTVVVSVVTRKTHPIYKKQYSTTQRLLAHDDKNQGQVGDKVLLTESRPISRHKHFVLSQVINRAQIAEADQVENIVPAEPAQEAEKPSEPKPKATKAAAPKKDKKS